MKRQSEVNLLVTTIVQRVAERNHSVDEVVVILMYIVAVAVVQLCCCCGIACCYRITIITCVHRFLQL